MKNSEFSKAGVSEDWIFDRTGIRERRILGPGEKNSDIAIGAAKEAIRKSGISGDEIDLILACTNSADRWMPGLAVSIQEGLGFKSNSTAFDITSACSGWLVGVQTACAFLRSGEYRKILVVAGEGFSRFLDWGDPQTCILFGDGAGACILELAEEGGGGQILDSQIYSDGTQSNILELYSLEKWLPLGAPILEPSKEIKLVMDGQQLFIQAARKIAAVSEEILERNGLSMADVDWLVPHQANYWIIQAVGQKVGIDPSRVAMNIEKFGNTISATIPTCLDQYLTDGKIKRGELVLLATFGAGTTWGAALLRW